MSNPLPAELLDYVIDHLRDTQYALRNCCLVSKSWVPRTRKHLFADIAFPTVGSLESWKKTFPDPSTSPAQYTGTLSIGCSHVVTAADAEEGGWIRGFSSVVHLELGDPGSRSLAASVSSSLVLFHGFSPVIKSLRITFPILQFLQVFNLILSFPLLEDLAVINSYYDEFIGSGDGPDWQLTVTQPMRPPMFTGSLKLFAMGRMEPFIRRLLSLPGGVHFWKLKLTWLRGEDLSLITGLVGGCYRTLESFDMTCNSLHAFVRRLLPR